MRIDYRLYETFVTVRGTLVTEIDRFDDSTRAPQPQAVTVETGVRGDDGNGLRTLEIPTRGADAEFSVGLTPDGRVGSLSYKATGVGARVLKAGATVLAFVGGTAARLAFGAPGAGAALRAMAVEEERAKAATPEEKAAAAWAQQNPDLARLRAQYEKALPGLADALLAARTEAAAAADAAGQVAAMARARRLERLLEDARREVAAIDDLYASWRATTITRSEAEVVRVLAVEEIPEADQGAQPQPGHFEGHVAHVWETLGVTVQLEPADGHVRTRHDYPPVHQPPLGDADEEARVLRWRRPRPARLTVWRRDAAGLPVLERSTPLLVLDDRCATEGVELTSALFGASSAAVTFDETGVPTTLERTREHRAGAFADAVEGLPAQLAAGLESASKVQSTVGTLLDAGAARRAASAKLELERAQNDLALKGLAATADDFARAKRLEQRVAIATAEGSLAPPSEVAAMEAELREVTARRNLAAARRDEALDLELAQVRAETARLAAMLELATARGRHRPDVEQPR